MAPLSSPDNDDQEEAEEPWHMVLGVKSLMARSISLGSHLVATVGFNNQEMSINYDFLDDQERLCCSSEERTPHRFYFRFQTQYGAQRYI